MCVRLTYSGGVMLGLLNILEPYNISHNGCLDSDLNTHRLVEAMKFAFGARSEITDPAFKANKTRLNEFYQKSWADEIRPLLSDVSVYRGVAENRTQPMIIHITVFNTIRLSITARPI